jgi:acyl-CoA synthetase (AMP-forming)/AMP-acid ligase II
MMDFESIERDRAARRAYWRARGVYTDRSYADAIRDGVKAGGGQKLIFHSRARPVETCTVQELNAEAEEVARAFHGLGLRCGDYIAIMLPSWRETAVAYVAAFKIGLAIVPIVAVYGAREIGFVMRETKAKALVIPDRWRGFDYFERVAAAGALPDMRHLIVVGEARGEGFVNWSDLSPAAGEAYPHPSGIADETCLVIYTSGTTSDPKGVKHSHNTLLCDLNAAAAGLEPAMPVAPPAGPVFGMQPAGHLAGFHTLIRPFVSPGADTIFVDQWFPEEAPALVEKYRIAWAAGTPIFLTTLIDALEKKSADLSSLRSFGLGGSAVTPETVRRADQLGLGGWRVYGMSEHSNVSLSLGDTFEKRAYTDGKITARNEVLIVDDDGHAAPPGEPGEVCTRGPRLFLGYMNRELDRACFLPGGWFRTGDIGALDADGYLTITDRKKDIIIRGGENISAKEIEDLLAAMPGVREAAVVAMPDAVMGERACAFVQPKPGAEISLEIVTDYFRSQGVVRLKTPERVIVVDDFDRTATGKIKKTDLREQLRAEAAAKG